MLLLAPAVHARADSLARFWIDRPITRIEVAGSLRTQTLVVTREMWHRPGRVVDLARLEQDRLHLLDLGLFARVELHPIRDPKTDAPMIRVELAERPSRLIYPTIDWDPEFGWSFGFYGRDRNLRGRAETAALEGSLGAQDRLSASLGTPWTAGRRVALAASVYYTRRDLEAEQIEEERRGFAVGLAPARSRVTSGWSEWGFEAAKSRPLDENAPGQSPEDDDHRWLSVGGVRDSRDYRLRADHGSRWSIGWIRHGGPLGGNTNFSRGVLDALRIFPTGRGTHLSVASRLIWSEGRVPRYLRLTLGGPNTLHGSPYGAFAGESRWIGWLEGVAPLIPTRTYSLGKRRSTVDITVDGAFFLDAGSVWEGNALRRGEAGGHMGGGFGLRILAPLVELLRLDLSTDGRGVRLDGTAGIRL